MQCEVGNKFMIFTDKMLSQMQYQVGSLFAPVKDEFLFSRPITKKVTEIVQKIVENRRISGNGIAKILKIDHKKVSRHMHEVEYTKNFDVQMLKGKQSLRKLMPCV